MVIKHFISMQVCQDFQQGEKIGDGEGGGGIGGGRRVAEESSKNT